MNEVAFLEKRQADWHRLRVLCDKADASPTQLTDIELLEFISLYKAASKDLATARTLSSNADLADYLNGLVSRAYSELYRPAPKPFRRAIAEGLVDVARAGRNLRWFSLASVVLILLGASFGWTVLALRPDMRDAIIRPEAEANFEVWKTGDFDERNLEESTLMTGFYGSNNPRVAIVSAAVGVASFGAFSAYILFQTGQELGALASELASVGHVSRLLTVLPHGVTEISGMVLAGAAGLRLGWALFAPGRRRRADSLKVAGKDVMVAMGASVVLMFLAAPVEGFISFNPRVPLAFKMGFASVVAIGWILFWTGYGRTSEQQQHEGEGRKIMDGV